MTDELHARTMRTLLDSIPSVHVAANFLRDIGLPEACVVPTRCAPARAEASVFADEGDIHFRGTASVKHLSITFHVDGDGNVLDWPYGRHFIVDETRKLDPEKDLHWWGVIVVSHDLRAAGIVTRSSYQCWKPEPRTLAESNLTKEMWIAPTRVVRWFRLPDYGFIKFGGE